MTIQLQDLYTKRNEIATMLQLDDNWPDLVDKLLSTNTNIEVLAAILMAYTDLSARNVIRIPELDALKREDVLPFYVYLMRRFSVGNGVDEQVRLALSLDNRMQLGEVITDAELDSIEDHISDTARESQLGSDRDAARIASLYCNTFRPIVNALEDAISAAARIVAWPEHFYNSPRATYNAKYKAMHLTIVTRFYHTLTTAKPC